MRFEPLAAIASNGSGRIPDAHIRWVSCARFVPDGESAWQQIISRRVDFTREVVIEKQGAEPEEICYEPDFARVETSVDTPALIRFRVESGRPGWLVLADQWYPGWVGTVDGQSVDIDRGNYLFQAIQVEAGSHVVEFQYQPVSFLVGAGISLFAFISMLVVGFWPRSRRG